MDFTDLLRAKPLVAAHLRSDLGAFVRSGWPVIHPGAKLHWNWHLDLLCEYLMLVKRREIRRLLINVPPRTAKTTVASIGFPVWCWLNDPALSFLCASYELDLADTHNLARRRLIESAWFQGLFADRFRLSSDRSLVSEFTSDRGGAMLSASVNSRAMGRGGDVVIIDDPLSADAAYSDIFRQQVNEWFEHMLPQRLNDPATSPIILIMQRLHESDPTGFLIEKEPEEWTHIRLPLVAEEDERWVFPISGRLVVRKAGECLDGKRFPPKVVKARQGNRLVWAGQFQQRPAPLEGNLVRVSDIQFFGGKNPDTGEQDADLPTTFDRRIISVDCTFKNNSTSDYVVVLVIGIRGSRRYVIHVSRGHMDLDGTENEVRHCHQVFGPISAVLVEDAANGASVISHLKENISGIIPVTPEGGKMSRMMAAAPEFMSRDWFIERHAPWTGKLIEELTLFPNARNDDLADAVSQAAIWLQQNTYEFGLIGLFKDIFAGKRKMPAAPEEIQQDGIATPPARCSTCGATQFSSDRLGTPPRFRCFNGHYNDAVGVSNVSIIKKPQCPACKSECLWDRGPAGFHCNSCSCDFDSDLNATSGAPESEDCGKSYTGKHIWKKIPGQQLKCDACGLQRWDGAPMNTQGMSRAQYARQRTVRREFGRFDRF